MSEREKIVKELHRPARCNYKRWSYKMIGIDDTWQADLVEMIPYSSTNKGFKYILTVIDCFSKFAWAIPLKSKRGEDVTAAFSSILTDEKYPKNLHTDQGKEFYNSNFARLMKKFKINHYSTFSNLKASICERFNRTLKEKMWQRFTLNGNNKWLDILDDLVTSYNNSTHRTINMKPKDVNSHNEEEIERRYALLESKKKKNKAFKAKYKVGDKVRVSRVKHLFEKSYTPSWSTEIFTIQEVMKTYPPTYRLKDQDCKPISGIFYEQEIYKTNHPDVYLIEKIVKRKGDRFFVKWLGFGNEHNSWINKDDYK
ncbi:hypothetical protein TKK_0014530 [Trichogramma kaykai]